METFKDTPQFYPVEPLKELLQCSSTAASSVGVAQAWRGTASTHKARTKHLPCTWWAPGERAPESRLEELTVPRTP